MESLSNYDSEIMNILVGSIVENPRSHVILVITTIGVDTASVFGRADDNTMSSDAELMVVTPEGVTNR